MAESLEHQRLAEDLADLLSMAGFAVVRRDAAGCRRPALIRGCRPDLVAWHLI
jgi:Holliday junction resolvase